jgi:hypothetical protein
MSAKFDFQYDRPALSSLLPRGVATTGYNGASDNAVEGNSAATAGTVFAIFIGIIFVGGYLAALLLHHRNHNRLVARKKRNIEMSTFAVADRLREATTAVNGEDDDPILLHKKRAQTAPAVGDSAFSSLYDEAGLSSPEQRRSMQQRARADTLFDLMAPMPAQTVDPRMVQAMLDDADL